MNSVILLFYSFIFNFKISTLLKAEIAHKMLKSPIFSDVFKFVDPLPW